MCAIDSSPTPIILVASTQSRGLLLFVKPLRFTGPSRCLTLTPSPLHEHNGCSIFVALVKTTHNKQCRVSDILNGESEVDKVLINNTDYLILPDMKWDLHTVDSLYLVAISHDSTLRSLRDLTTSHIPLLKSIRRDAHSAAAKWGLGEGDLRMFIHYQPSYCSTFLSFTRQSC